MRWLLTSALCLLVGCEPIESVAPAAGHVRVQLVERGVPKDALEGPVRYAVAWTVQVGDDVSLEVTDDGPIDLHDDGTLVELRLPDDPKRLFPQERLPMVYTDESFLYASVQRPRFVLYTDRNLNERFDADVLDHEGPDRVLGVDVGPRYVAGLLDAEAALRSIPFALTESFYLATGGDFTSFVSVVDNGGSLELREWSPSVPVDIDLSDYPLASLQCMRPALTPRSTRRIVLDDDVDEALCGLDAAQCEQLDLHETQSVQALVEATQGRSPAPQCRRRDDLVALAMMTTTRTCDFCACWERRDQTVLVVNGNDPPDWWPCGRSVVYCNSEDLFAAYVFGCVIDFDDRVQETSP